MTGLEIIKAWLKANGYDGLYTEDCGCSVDDLAPCSESPADCMAGYILPRNAMGGDFSIGPRKEGKEDAN